MTPATSPTLVLDEFSAEWSALGCAVRLVVTDQDSLWLAAQLLDEEIKAVDQTCSRFRTDSELMQIRSARGEVIVSQRFCDALSVALRAAQLTDGLLDPTVGVALAAFGYDRDFAALPADGPVVSPPTPATATWRDISLAADQRRLTVPPGIEIDLGATAKAWAADGAATRISRLCECGVLVSLGGDVAVAGPAPEGGWSIRVQEKPGPIEATPEGTWCDISLADGAVATSSVQHRRWKRGDHAYHHIIDPRTCLPAESPWRTVSVAAATCVGANTASTASILLGEHAPDWLREHQLPAWLVSTEGAVHALNGWPVSTA
jgi:thiamine biosynthesis lipoprotein ApbE